MRRDFPIRSVTTRSLGAAAVFTLAAAAAPLVAPAALSGDGSGLVAVAGAHSVLVSTEPAQSSTVPESPQRVALTFNENISKDFAHVTVMREGKNLAEGDPQVDGRTVSVAVPKLDGGDYLVGYRVVSADGHPVQGSWSFTVAGAAASDTAAPASDAPADTAAQDNKGGSGQMVGAIALFGGFAVLLIAGAFVLLRRQKKMNEEYS